MGNPISLTDITSFNEMQERLEERLDEIWEAMEKGRISMEVAKGNKYAEGRETSIDRYETIGNDDNGYHIYASKWLGGDCYDYENGFISFEQIADPDAIRKIEDQTHEDITNYLAEQEAEKEVKKAQKTRDERATYERLKKKFGNRGE